MIKENYIYVGIDLHKETHTAVMIDCYNQKLGEITFPNRPADFPKLVTKVKKCNTDGKEVVYGLENAYGYGRALAVWLIDKGYLVKDVNTAISHRQAKHRGAMYRKSDSDDAEAIALATSGAVGSDLANMINEAAITAVKHGRQVVSQKDLFEAVEVVLVGKEKKDRIMSQKERRIVSYHEVGHALVTALQKDAEPVQKITIVPRTMGALGYVMQTPEEEKFLNTKKELQAMLVGLLAGRAAEEVVFDTVTTGASNDIEKATSVARAMITQYGMSERFGLMGLESVQSRYLDGRAVRNCGEATAAEIDEEVMKMLKDAYEEAKQLLRNHRQALDKIAAFLIEKETITGKEFMEIFHEVEGIDPDAPKKEEARIGMNPVEGEGFVMKPADDIDDAHNADVQEKSEKTEEKTVGTATESVHEE